jgi:hypothetical protein
MPLVKRAQMGAALANRNLVEMRIPPKYGDSVRLPGSEVVRAKAFSPLAIGFNLRWDAIPPPIPYEGTQGPTPARRSEPRLPRCC